MFDPIDAPSGGFGIASVRYGETPEIHVYLTGMPAVSAPISVAGGAFRIRRQAGVTSVSASAGDVYVDRAVQLASTGAALVSIGLSNQSDAVLSGDTSVHFTGFGSNRDATAAPEPFLCDPVRR
jgi:hypothetical protein